MSRTTTTAPSGMLRVRRTRRKRKRDMRLQPSGECGTDPLHALQTLERSERAVRGPLLHDARRERWTDPGEALEIRSGRDIEVDHEFARCRRACRGAVRRGTVRRRRRRARRRSPATGRDGGVHSRDLQRERRSVGRGRLRRPQRRDPTDGDAECRDRGDEQEGAMLGGRWHAEALVRWTPSSAPVHRGPARGLPPRSCVDRGPASRSPRYAYSGVLMFRCCCDVRRFIATSRGPSRGSRRHRRRSAASTATPCPACPRACGATGSRGRSRRSPAAPWRGAAHGHP